MFGVCQLEAAMENRDPRIHGQPQRQPLFFIRVLTKNMGCWLPSGIIQPLPSKEDQKIHEILYL
jgi:hypothetical protein